MTGLADLGEQRTGQVLDPGDWEHESRVRAAFPHRHATGTVRVIYVRAPEVVGLELDDGQRVTVLVDACGCPRCPHDLHEPGDCLVATLTPEGLDGYCLCGASTAELPVAVLTDADLLRQRELADAAWEHAQDVAELAAAERES